MSEALVQQTADELRVALPGVRVIRHGDALFVKEPDLRVVVSHAQMCVAGEDGIKDLVANAVARARVRQ